MKNKKLFLFLSRFFILCTLLYMALKVTGICTIWGDIENVPGIRSVEMDPGPFATLADTGYPELLPRSDEEATYASERTWVLDHQDIFPDGKAERSADNPELIHFMFMLGTNAVPSYDAGTLSADEISGDMPFLFQWDERWGFHEYGDDNIGFSGCGPTCLAMVLASFTQDALITPAAIADYAMNNGYYAAGAGTSWSFMTDAAEAFGVHASQINTSEIIDMLSAGHPVIASVRKGHFTSSGHFIVLAGIKDGRIIIHDPNSVSNSKKLWSFDDFKNEIKSAWGYGQSESEEMILITDHID